MGNLRVDGAMGIHKRIEAVRRALWSLFGQATTGELGACAAPGTLQQQRGTRRLGPLLWQMQGSGRHCGKRSGRARCHLKMSAWVATISVWHDENHTTLMSRPLPPVRACVRVRASVETSGTTTRRIRNAHLLWVCAAYFRTSCIALPSDVAEQKNHPYAAIFSGIPASIARRGDDRRHGCLICG